MRKIFLLAVGFVLFSNVINAQNAKRDVVYLKNGSIIKGEIIEQVPNKTMTIQTMDGSVFVYPFNDIKKITKEKILKEAYQTKEKKENSKKHFSYYSFNIGTSYKESQFGVSLSLVELNIASNNGWGGTLKWGSAATSMEVTYYDGYNNFRNSRVDVGLGYLLAGASYSSKRGSMIGTYRLMLGGGKFMAKSEYLEGYSDFNFAAGFGTTTRFFANNRWNMTLGTDFIYCEGFLINVNLGFAYSW